MWALLWSVSTNNARHPQGKCWYERSIWLQNISSSFVLKKSKCTLLQALRLCTGRTAHRGSRGIALPFHDHGTRRGEGSASRPGRSQTPGKTQYSFYMRLGGPQGRSGQVRITSPPPGFDPRTVQPVASRYTDYATRPPHLYLVSDNLQNVISVFDITQLLKLS
jgi:hypothetical protein